MTHAEMRAAVSSAPRGAIIRAVYTTVMLHIGKNGEPCTASIQTIADEAGVNIKTAKRALRDLVPVWLERVDTPGKPTRFTVPTPPALRAHPKTGPPENGPTRREGPEVVEPDPTGLGGKVVNLFDGTPVLPEASPRVPARTPAPARAKPTPPNAELFEALVEAAGWQISDLTPAQRTRTGKAAKNLASVGKTPEQVRTNGIRIRTMWKRHPTPWQIEEHWRDASQLEPLTWTPPRRAPS